MSFLEFKRAQVASCFTSSSTAFGWLCVGLQRSVRVVPCRIMRLRSEVRGVKKIDKLGSIQEGESFLQLASMIQFHEDQNALPC